MADQLWYMTRIQEEEDWINADIHMATAKPATATYVCFHVIHGIVSHDLFIWIDPIKVLDTPIIAVHYHSLLIVCVIVQQKLIVICLM